MNEINRLRKNVDEVDEKILELLDQRMKIVKELYKIKEKERMPIIDKKREEKVEKIWLKKAEKLGINNESIFKILNEILNMSRETQLNG